MHDGSDSVFNSPSKSQASGTWRRKDGQQTESPREPRRRQDAQVSATSADVQPCECATIDVMLLDMPANILGFKSALK